jgi:hypothetical protein
MRLGAVVDNKHQHLAPSTADPDFYSVLLRVIDSTRNDPAYLRSLIYELARSKLHRGAFIADMRMSEVRQHLLALESATDSVEAISQEESIQPGGGLVPTVYNLDEIEPEIDQYSNPLSKKNLNHLQQHCNYDDCDGREEHQAAGDSDSQLKQLQKTLDRFDLLRKT